jgi:AAA family ATP:ADP antiporter
VNEGAGRSAAPNGGALAAAVTSGLLIAQQVAGKAARDALFLSSFDVAHLPGAMAAGAATSLLAVYLLSRSLTRHGPAAIVPVLFAASSVAFMLDWLVAGHAPGLAALLVYFQTAALAPVMISAFWSMINERFDPHTAKRTVHRITSGGTLGGVLGGVAVWRASTLVQPAAVLLLLAALNGLACGSSLLARARGPALPLYPRQVASDEVSPLKALSGSPFLHRLAMLVALGSAISALLDYVFGAQATASFGRGQQLLSFFSLFWLAVGALSFLLQVAFGRLVLEKLSLGVNIALLPGVITLGSALGLAVPGLASASILRGAEAAQRNTLFRAAYELLYTPVPEHRKRATKAFIDVGCDRLGTIVGSGVALFAIYFAGAPHQALLLAVVALLAIATLPLSRRLQADYVDALEQGLRDADARLKSAGRSSLSAVSQRPSLLDRERLIERVEQLQPGGLTAVVENDGDSAPSATEQHAPAPTLDVARQLLSKNPASVREGLSKMDSRGPEVPCAIALLADSKHHEAVLARLAALAPSITGQLLDALLDPTTPFMVRRRIPRALRTCSTQRAADGLLLGVADPRFEVRYECGRALLKVTELNPEVKISLEVATQAIRSEVENSQRLVERSAQAFEEDGAGDEESSLVAGLMRDRVSRSLEHVFTILSLLLEREPLRIAFRALHQDDQKYRGTALEYLETTLPPDLREAVWPCLGEGKPLGPIRPVAELLADLVAQIDGASGASATTGSSSAR